MKIIYKKGNALEGPEYYFIHGCNSVGVMGSGIAREVKEKYPKAFTDYIASDRLLGEVYMTICEDKVIFNLISQKYYGKDPNVRYVSYDALHRGLYLLDKLFLNDLPRKGGSTIPMVAMPRIGAGRGNGDWENKIVPIIEKASNYWQPVVYDLEGEVNGK